MSLVGTGGLEMMREGQEALDITPFVRRFVWTDSMLDGGFTWSLHLTTDFWEEWNDVILGAEDVRFRLKFQAGQETTTDWRTAVSDSARIAYRSTAMTFEVPGADKRLDLLQKERTRAWPNSSVSDLVQAIGAEYGLDVMAEATTGRHDRWQAREFDWTYLRRSVEESASSKGRGDMYLWLDEGTLRLDVPQLQRGSDRRHDMSEVENRVDRIVLAYHGREIDRAGGATLVGIGFDFDTKSDLVFTLNGQRAETHPALARRVPRDPADGLRVIPVQEHTAALVEEATRGHWGRFGPRYFSLRLDSRPDLALRPGMVMELQGNLGAQQETPFLGRFAVLEVQHILAAGMKRSRGSGGLQTTAVCYRREAFAGREEPTGTSVSNVRTRDAYRAGQEQTPVAVLAAEVLE